MECLLSVVVPYANCIDYIGRLLNSIPESDVLEVIVVNDNSDDISNIVARHRNVKYICSSIKRGAGGARNIGIQHAAGRYLVFADADDYFVDGWFEKVLEDVAAGDDLIFYPPLGFDENGGECNRNRRYVDLVNCFLGSGNDDLIYRFYPPWSKIYRRGFVESRGILFDEVSVSNDVMFSLRAGFFADKVSARNYPIYTVVERSGSLTKLVSEDVLDLRFSVACRANEFLMEVAKKDRMLPMLRHVARAYQFGLYKSLYLYCFCKYKGYPLFGNWRDFVRYVKLCL